MKIITDTITLSTQGRADTVNLTPEIDEALSRSCLSQGTVTLFVIGSTAGLSTIEYEPGLKKDMKIAFEKIAPSDGHYHHHDTWHDDNGSSHVRATLVGPSLTVPFVDGRLTLGTWQQIVLLDFDTRPRNRQITAQFIGE